MHEGTTDDRTPANSFLTALDAQRPREQFYSVNRGDQWMNYSNKQGDSFLSQPQLYDAILGGKLNPLGTYQSADEAYQGYMGLNPNKGPAAQQPWGQQWSPLFLPPQMNAQGQGQTPTPTPTPGPAPPPQPNPATPIMAQTMPTSSLAWANAPWQQNMLMSGDRYGEFGSARGL